MKHWEQEVCEIFSHLSCSLDKEGCYSLKVLAAFLIA